MNARCLSKKVIPTDCAEVVTVLHASRQLSKVEVAAVEKDLHLIAAARSADHFILSLDEVTRRVLRKLNGETHVLAALNWADPVSDYDGLPARLTTGQSADPAWGL